MKKLLKNRAAFTGLVFLTVVILAAAFAPLITPYDPSSQDLTQRLAAPSAAHILGTDDLGRDVLSRIIYGARISISVGFFAVLLTVIIGSLVGMFAGYFGGVADSALMRFTDIMLCFPTFFLILLVIAFFEPNIYNVMIVIGITSWTGLARIVRAEVLSVREREFVLASKMLAVSKFRLFFRHILPNVISPIIVYSAIGVGSAILTESGLSFLGLGVQPPTASWGQILMQGKDYIYVAWWLSVFPGIAILLTVLSFNLLGETLRDVLDPKDNT
ncbi:ABC transporter permease [Endomicrobium proavitum]|uniref:Dipeptide transporter n=1 Tax=Endomicrobium proavitum TaxID=1408281 RepID=A0A0G3WJ68_9BACT|nr:ABC transporter permease [Endomicrobium proavitum]AKL97499.1 dipeptide transporter [Endomicrobium proavitum]